MHVLWLLAGFAVGVVIHWLVWQLRVVAAPVTVALGALSLLGAAWAYSTLLSPYLGEIRSLVVLAGPVALMIAGVLATLQALALDWPWWKAFLAEWSDAFVATCVVLLATRVRSMQFDGASSRTNEDVDAIYQAFDKFVLGYGLGLVAVAGLWPVVILFMRRRAKRGC
jgi:hypothetical protein